MRHARVVTRVVYEWDLEQFDPETQDIIDHNHSDECPGLPTQEDIRLVLIRDEWEGLSGDEFNMSADLKHRAWCYVDGKTLPTEFDDGKKVPQKLLKEFEGTLR